MDKIVIDDSAYYFKGRIDSDIDNSIFLSKIKTLCYLYPQLILKETAPVDISKIDKEQGVLLRPHNELNLGLVRLEETSKIIDFAANFLSKSFNTEYLDYIIQPWVLLAENSSNKNFYHDHLYTEQVVNQWSFCYYVQIPDNLTGDQGKLMFKSNNGKEVGILPNEGDLIIFPSTLLHKPVDHLNSSKQRVVFCCNFSFLKTVGLKVNSSLL